jgi:HK97 gp10 family phage protein
MPEKTFVIIGLTEVKRLFDGSDKEVAKRGRRMLFNLGNFSKKALKDEVTKKGSIDLGELHDGMFFRTTTRQNEIETVVRPSDKADKYAIFVERGTKPHRPPISALQGWADRHGIPVGAVVGKIARDGTDPRWFARDAMEVIRPEAEKEMKQFLSTLLEE